MLYSKIILNKKKSSEVHNYIFKLNFLKFKLKKNYDVYFFISSQMEIFF